MVDLEVVVTVMDLEEPQQIHLIVVMDHMVFMFIKVLSLAGPVVEVAVVELVKVDLPLRNPLQTL